MHEYREKKYKTDTLGERKLDAPTQNLGKGRSRRTRYEKNTS